MPRSEYIKYTADFYTNEHAGYSDYFPDAVLEPFIQPLRDVLQPVFNRHMQLDQQANILPSLNTHCLVIAEPVIPLAESFSLVVAAFHDFDPVLGNKAERAVQDPERWILKQVPVGEAGGRCCAGQCPPWNEKDFAVITYDYDHTICDAIYIAHELGHLFVYDSLAHKKRHYPHGHMAEIQAHFTQHILYDALMTHPDAKLRHAATQHYIGEVTRGLYNIPIALGILDKNNASSIHPAKKYEALLEKWLGPHWAYFTRAKNIREAIEDHSKSEGQFLYGLHKHCMGSLISAGLFDLARHSKALDRRKIGILCWKKIPAKISFSFLMNLGSLLQIICIILPNMP